MEVSVEVGTRRAFAAAIDWPGWCRAGRDEAAALQALSAAGARYKRALGTVARGLKVPADPSGFTVIERVPGDATTDFGAPSIQVDADRVPLDDAETRRVERILRACWAAFDAAVASAAGVELRTGPRGGGRELDAIVEHVLGADAGYLTSLGARSPKSGGVEEIRAAILDAFRARARGDAPPNPSRTKKPWPPRYYARRSAWHVLDHAWEIEDRSSG